MLGDSYKTLIGFLSYHVITCGHVLTVMISEAEHISEVIVFRAAET